MFKYLNKVPTYQGSFKSDLFWGVSNLMPKCCWYFWGTSRRKCMKFELVSYNDSVRIHFLVDTIQVLSALSLKHPFSGSIMDQLLPSPLGIWGGFNCSAQPMLRTWPQKLHLKRLDICISIPNRLYLHKWCVFKKVTSGTVPDCASINCIQTVELCAGSLLLWAWPWSSWSRDALGKEIISYSQKIKHHGTAWYVHLPYRP